MSTTRLSVMTSLAMLCACSASNESGLYLSADKGTFDGRTQHAVLRVQAFTPNGSPGQGVVSFSTPAGSFVGSADAELADGFATITFQCDPSVDTACSGPLRLSATWGGLSAGVTVRVTPSTVLSAVNWKVVPTNSLATLAALAPAADGQTLWACGSAGEVLRYSGGSWTAKPTGVTAALTALSVGADDAPIVVGEHGTLLVWQSGAFQRVETFLPDVTFTALVAASATDAELATATGAIYHFDGSTLTLAYDLGSPIASMVRNGAVLWAGGEGVLALKSDGTSWSSAEAPVLARYSVALSSAEGLWLAGARMDTSGGVMLLGPVDWRTETLADPITALAVVPAGDERFAVTASKVYRQVGTGSWLSVDAPSGGAAAYSRSSGDLVVVGPPGFSLMRVP